MWNDGSLHPLPGKFVDDSVCAVVPAGSTWARTPVPRIHTDNIGMAWIGACSNLDSSEEANSAQITISHQ